jgi:hypothetical protein
VESTLERRVLYCLLANREIVDIRDQWPVVPYALPDGRTGSHTFDFWVRYSSGFRKAIAVRTEARVLSLGRIGITLPEMLDSLVTSVFSRFADGREMFTDADVSEEDVDNAREILLSRKHYHEGDYLEALAYVAPICGAVRFHDLLKGAAVPAYRRMALWCLIDDGILFPTAAGRITDLSAMQVNRQLIRFEGRAA